MGQCRREVVNWVAREVLPHERDVRLWLGRRGIPADQADDILQEAYCRISALDHVGHIISGRAYLFQTARNILLEQIRRSRIVRIETVAEFEQLNIVDDSPSPDAIAARRQEWRIVRDLIAGLPDACRQIFELRRIHGVSQREIAARLNVTENTVEAQSIRGLKLILEGLSRLGHDVLNGERHERSRNRARN